MKSQESTKHNQVYKICTNVKKLPGISTLRKTTAWQILRFKMTLLSSPRRNCHFTRFLRLPTQFEALSGPVLDVLLKNRTRKALKVTVMGCSAGAEAYSIASVLRNRHPDLVFTVYGYDIDSDCISKARSGRYTPEEVLNNEIITSGFINATFDREKGYYVIKSDIRKHVHFDVADALDPKLREQIGTSDVLYAQQLLIHLKHRQAVKGFKNILRLLNSRAALFIAGIELDMLVNLTRKNNLIPCEYKIAEIHSEIELTEGGWPYVYWGREPFMTVRKDWQRRYSTIFLNT